VGESKSEYMLFQSKDFVSHLPQFWPAWKQRSRHPVSRRLTGSFRTARASPDEPAFITASTPPPRSCCARDPMRCACGPTASLFLIKRLAVLSTRSFRIACVPHHSSEHDHHLSRSPPHAPVSLRPNCTFFWASAPAPPPHISVTLSPDPPHRRP